MPAGFVTVGVILGGMATFVPPTPDATTFTCLHCDTLAAQAGSAVGSFIGGGDQLKVHQCTACYKYSVWEKRSAQGFADWILVYPDRSPAAAPNEDLPEDVKQVYDEAASIFNRSPRGAAALLRLGIQRLCKHLGQPGKNINGDIKALVKSGLSPIVQQAMDTVRITGNEAVHPGEINLDDDRELASSLFIFVNLIAEYTITGPRVVKEMYERLPEPKRDAVDKRDA